MSETANRQVSPALEKAYQFLACLIPTLDKFPRRQKFLLGDRVACTKLDILEGLMEATGREIVASRGHEDQVLSVAFSPDGRTLATGSYDKTARLWPVAQGLIDRACARVQDLPLSDRDKQRFGIEKEWCTSEVSAELRTKLGLDRGEAEASAVSR
jgi:WD domain, G-beta repeat